MSRARRGATSLSGIIAIDKPAGMTSHDVVSAVRRATGERRVGHAGTLDPMATGLLVVLVGPMTRLERFISAASKTYEATIRFGEATDTDDAEGRVVEMADVPEWLFDAERVQRELLDGFLGESMQMPPTYSAIKVGGKIAHRVARGGGELELAARRVYVGAAEIVSANAEARSWEAWFTVSKGTYIRSLARDIGRAAGTVAHLTALRRIESGSLRLDRDAHSLDEVRLAGERGRVEELFLDPIEALGIPFIDLDDQGAAAVSVGRSLPCPDGLADGSHVALAHEGRLVAVYRRSGELLSPAVVLGKAAA